MMEQRILDASSQNERLVKIISETEFASSEFEHNTAYVKQLRHQIVVAEKDHQRLRGKLFQVITHSHMLAKILHYQGYPVGHK
jgi:hypothetical protein